MTSWWDIAAGVLCLWMAVCIGGLHVVSGRKHPNWVTIPGYVRVGLAAVVLMFLCRGVDFLTLPRTASAPGHIDAAGLTATIVLAYLVSASTYWVFCLQLPARAMARLLHAWRELRRQPDLAPVMMSPAEVNDVHHAAGDYAIGAGEGALAAVREARRLPPPRLAPRVRPGA